MNMTAPSDSNKIVVGYTTQEHLLVDLDGCSWVKVQALASMICKAWPILGDVLIVESSPAHYHLIFDNRVTWDTIVRVIETLYDLGVVEENYRQVRNFRRDLTLRVSDKIGTMRYHEVPNPKLILQTRHDYKQAVGIRRYLDMLNAFNPISYYSIPKEVIPW